jgi:preprotein translocase subunit SecG
MTITFIAIIHIIACLGLVTLVLIQDSKGGGVFTSQASSNSVLGAGGATTLAQTMTKVIAGVFATTCIVLSIMSAKNDKSVIDSTPLTSAPISAPATPETTSAAAATAAPVEQPKK